jgi:tetratricopeptide (TPR) repeat protein
MTQPKAKRDRGRILTNDGWKKIWDAINQKFPDGHTFQAISDLTDPLIHKESVDSVSVDTISNILKREKPADKGKIESLFRAFGLKLDANDHDSFKSYTLKSNSDLAEGAATPCLSNLSFVGRENAIAKLNTLIRQGSKIILIQAAGGIGKTTLAEQFLYSQGFELVLKLPMAKEKENIQLVESVIEGWLKQDFEEETGREFWVSLERLKRQLQSRKIGVLIDNLEPALDGQGQFIEPHRRYIELLRMLADPMVQSVTLITSRERLCEPNVTVEPYGLQGLDDDAWQQFFTNSNWHIDIDRSTLNAMHKAYGGNAKAMGILCGAIREDFDGDMVAYWQENSTDPLAKTDLNNLVNSQFNRLKELDLDAYKLLCRLGCYRYQDVPKVPIEGLLCLLWDVPEIRQRRVVESLRDRSLVEFYKGEYWLHPLIRAEAISRLRDSEDWEEANRKAADFWTDSVKTVETVEDALRAFEAYYHYLALDNFDSAANVIVKSRSNQFHISEPLGIAFYRLGLLQQMKLAITKIINQINPGYVLSRLHNILGDIYWLTGKIKNSIESHEQSRIIAANFQVRSLEIVSFFNIGLCQIELLEIQKGITFLEKVISMAENTDYHRYAVISYYCLAFLKSCLDLKNESLEFAQKSAIPADSSLWELGYRLLFLGQTYKNLKLFEKSFEIYRQAIQFAEKSHYTQVKAKALYGLAELYRIQGELTTALSHHLEAIELLDKIGAKCDLAEAYYQLGLTYQKMSQIDKSQEYFDNAIKLFEEMEAPKQVEKVQKAKGNR